MARANRETWAKRVERWKESGLSAKEFASELGVSAKALSWWRWQLGKATPTPTRPRPEGAGGSVSPLTFVEMSAPLRNEPLEVVFPGGMRIRVPIDFDSSALERLMQVVDKRR
jgi:hypothetical protein